MPLATARVDLIAFGYVKLIDIQAGEAHCSACNAPIEWWGTPRGKKMPFRVTMVEGVERLIPHFSDCPKATSFRRSPTAGGSPR